MSIYTNSKKILDLPRSAKRIIVIFGDIAICFISVWITYGILTNIWLTLSSHMLEVFLLSVFIATPIFFIFDLYLAIFRYIGSLAFIALLKSYIVYQVVFCAVIFFGFMDVPFSVSVLQPLIFFNGIGLCRYLVRFWLGKIDGINESFHRTRPRVLVYGAGAAGRQLVAALNVNKTMEVKGFIDDDMLLHGNSINGVVVFNPSQLNIIIESKNITDVILAIPSASQSDRNRIIERLTQIGVRVQSIPGLIDRRSGRILASDIKNLQMSDLLGRETVNLDTHLLKRKIKNRTVFVTGAGGSIGSEICRQIVKYEPSTIVLLDNCEYALYLIEKELLKINLAHGVGKNSYENGGMTHIVPHLASVQDHDALECAISLHMPDIVFHAAAYKHVSLVEKNPIEAIKNNVFGTLTCAKISIAHGVKNFILVSTDKAVRPTSIMGASKRISEMVLQALSDEHKIESSTICSMVRFGNVLGSSGSVVPIFREQINQGGPITLTDLEVTRYFMTIPEAAQLVIQAYAMSLGGEVFVLDMGHPVKIYELAQKMINLSGHRVKSDLCPDGDIEIKVIGLRPGEKLFEELLIGENALSTDHPKIMKAQEEFLNWKVLESRLDEIRVALIGNDMKSIEGIFKEIVYGYNRIV